VIIILIVPADGRVSLPLQPKLPNRSSGQGYCPLSGGGSGGEKTHVGSILPWANPPCASKGAPNVSVKPQDIDLYIFTLRIGRHRQNRGLAYNDITANKYTRPAKFGVTIRYGAKS
jgi:hypothetical protein